MADVCITEFTDPGCPWAWSAEPFRRRLSWLYGDRLEWRVRVVGLSASPEDYLDKGFTPERQAQAFARISRDHGMPIDTAQRPRMAATLPACRAVVAARCTRPTGCASCCAGCASATSPASCSTSPRRSPAPRATPAWTRRSSTAGPRAPRSPRSCARTSSRGARADARRARARPQAGQLVGRPALHLPVLRDRPRRRRRPHRRAGLSAVRRLRRDHGQPRPRPRPPRPAADGRGGPRAGPARRWPPRRSPSSATSASPTRASALGRVAQEQHLGADGLWTLPG